MQVPELTDNSSRIVMILRFFNVFHEKLWEFREKTFMKEFTIKKICGFLRNLIFRLPCCAKMKTNTRYAQSCKKNCISS